MRVSVLTGFPTTRREFRKLGLGGGGERNSSCCSDETLSGVFDDISYSFLSDMSQP